MGFYEQVKQATIRIKESGSPNCDEIPRHFNSQGVVVPNGYIITAAHCLDWEWVWQAARNNYYPVGITNQAETKTCLVVPVAVIVGSMVDIAVLGKPDDQEMHTEYRLYEEFFKEIEPLQIYSEPKLKENCDVYTFTHKNDWVKGWTINVVKNPFFEISPILWVKYDEKIEGGTSGGPIVNENGQLLSVVSSGNNNELHNSYIYQCLPRWIIDKILQ